MRQATRAHAYDVAAECIALAETGMSHMAHTRDVSQRKGASET